MLTLTKKIGASAIAALALGCSALERPVPPAKIQAGVVGGTMVSQYSTFGPVETIAVGDTVDSPNPERLYRSKLKRVLDVRSQIVPETYFILMEHTNLMLEVSGSTQLLTWGFEWKRADQLTTEDILIGSLTSSARVIAIELRTEAKRIYWLDVEDWHSFRVGRFWFPVRE
ncbi:MAG: hypothetical protein NXI24_24595 [bacterium]|nr:hypothetical protein [bacterium]